MPEQPKKIHLHAQPEKLVRLKEVHKAIVAKRPALPKIGDKMPDGTIYAGISPDTHRPMYAAPADKGVLMSFNRAAEYAASLEVGGKKDFRLPTKAELNLLFENMNKGTPEGTFNETGWFPGGWYWSSTPDTGELKSAQRFSDGRTDSHFPIYNHSVRCVRGS